MSENVTAGRRPARFFERIGSSPGLAIYTLGDEVGQDLDAAFAQVAEIGYRHVELPNLYGREAAQIRSSADRAGVAISSLQLFAIAGPMGAGPGLSLLSEPSQIADCLGELGACCAVLALPLLPDTMRPEPDEGLAEMLSRTVVAGGVDIWKRSAALLNERAAALKPFGVELAFHNHNLEFAPVGDTDGWEILVQETDPGHVKFEVDVAWVAAAGRDPAAFLQRLRGRVSQLHVKDLKPGTPTNFAIRADCMEVGSGVLGWTDILRAAEGAGARRYYVEQEPPFEMSRLESVRRSYEFLATLEA